MLITTSRCYVDDDNVTKDLWLTTNPSVHPSICLPIHPPIRPSIHTYTHTSIHPSICSPVESIDHLQVTTEVLLGEVPEHPGVDQALHEGRSVLWQSEGGEPLIANPLVAHLPESCQLMMTMMIMNVEIVMMMMMVMMVTTVIER